MLLGKTSLESTMSGGGGTGGCLEFHLEVSNITTLYTAVMRRESRISLMSDCGLEHSTSYSMNHGFPFPRNEALSGRDSYHSHHLRPRSMNEYELCCPTSPPQSAVMACRGTALLYVPLLCWTLR